MSKFIDITGQRFSRLTVLRREGRTNSGEAKWHCRCDCGNEKGATSRDLREGRTKSCGCLRREIGVEVGKALIRRQARDLLNLRFGRLLVVNRVLVGNRTRWEVLCDCDQRRVVMASALTSGSQVSCGCFNKELRKGREPVNKLPRHEAKRRRRELFAMLARARSERLADGYVKQTLSNQGIKTQDITPELIEAKRFALSLKRGMKKFQQAIIERTEHEQG